MLWCSAVVRGATQQLRERGAISSLRWLYRAAGKKVREEALDLDFADNCASSMWEGSIFCPPVIPDMHSLVPILGLWMGAVTAAQFGIMPTPAHSIGI